MKNGVENIERGGQEDTGRRKGYGEEGKRDEAL